MHKNYQVKIRVLKYALIIGIISGLISLIFNWLVTTIMATIQPHSNQLLVIIIMPLTIALIVYFIRQKVILHNQGFGVAQVMFEIEHIQQLMMKPRDVIAKVIGTMLTLIAGFSIGKQGPIVHIGGAIGSNIANYTKSNRDETRVLIGCGVAGCLAGIYNAPIFATLFVVEILFKKRYFDMISTILLSAMTSALIVRIVSDTHFLGNFASNFTFEMIELPFFILLGIITSLLAYLYVISLGFSHDVFHKNNGFELSKLILGAVVTIFALLYLKDFYFYNSNPISLMTNGYSLLQLALIPFVYIFLTSITIGTGYMGGIFAPGLFIGLSSGLAVATALTQLGFPVADIKTYALAGMASMYAGFAIAPLSATLLIVEVTGQYNLLFPMLLSALIASKFSEFTLQDSIYHRKLANIEADFHAK